MYFKGKRAEQVNKIILSSNTGDFFFSSRDDAGLLPVSIGDFDPVSFQTV